VQLKNEGLKIQNLTPVLNHLNGELKHFYESLTPDLVTELLKKQACDIQMANCDHDDLLKFILEESFEIINKLAFDEFTDLTDQNKSPVRD